MRGMRVVLAVLVCLLALSFTEAIERKSLHTLRNRLQAAVSVEGRDDMQPAQEQFRLIKPDIDREFAQLTPKSDAVEERRVYTTLANSILTRIAPLLGPNVVLVAPFANLNANQLELASKIAYLFRHELRIKTREHMASRGNCAAFMQWLAKVRDYFVYGDPNGPTYPSLVDKAMKSLKIAKLEAGVLPVAISSKILISSTTTNENVNKLLGVTPTGAVQSIPSDANDGPLLVVPDLDSVKKLDQLMPSPKANPLQTEQCSKGDRVLAQAYAASLQGPNQDVQVVLSNLQAQFDTEPLELVVVDQQAPSANAAATAVAPTAKKGQGK